LGAIVPGVRRNPAAISRDRRRIAKMYLRGELQADIAKDTGLTESMVSRDLKALQDEWRASSLIDIDEAKAKELARIDELERTYWQAWARSQEDAEIERTKVTDGLKEGKRYEAGKETKGQVGDPRFLQGVQWCIERRCKVIGIDAPTKQEIRLPDGVEQRVIFEEKANWRGGNSLPSAGDAQGAEDSL